MNFTTRAELRSAQRKVLIEKSASALSAVSNVFLSHSSKEDQGVLNGAISVLGGAGGKVYADYIDPEAKELTPIEFGRFFREAITDCGRLVVLLSDVTGSSRWVPWELGVADGEFGHLRAAIWPVVDRASDDPYWAKQEFMNIYPVVEHVRLDGDTERAWAVRDPGDGLYWRLDRWLKRE